MGISYTRIALNVSITNDIINQAILDFRPTSTTTQVALNYFKSVGGENVYNSQILNLKSQLNSVYNVTQNSLFETQIATTVAQDVEKTTQALISDLNLFKSNDITLKTAIVNKVSNLNLSVFAPLCIANQDVQNIAENYGTKNFINVQQASVDLLQSCVASTSNTAAMISGITNTANQRVKVTEENPLDFLSKIFNNIILIIVVIAVILVCGGGIFLLSGRRNPPPETPPPPENKKIEDQSVDKTKNDTDMNKNTMTIQKKPIILK